MEGKIVVGHTLEKDFEVLGLDIKPKLVRDVAVFRFFMNGKKKVKLSELCLKYLNIKIQGGVHSSAEDARAALELYKLYKKEIDIESKDKVFRKKKIIKKKKKVEGDDEEEVVKVVKEEVKEE